VHDCRVEHVHVRPADAVAAGVELHFADVDGAFDTYTVEVAQIEQLDRNDGARQQEPVSVEVYGAEGSMTGPQARQLAAALLDAADAWDEAAA